MLLWLCEFYLAVLNSDLPGLQSGAGGLRFITFAMFGLKIVGELARSNAKRRRLETLTMLLRIFSDDQNAIDYNSQQQTSRILWPQT